jgi:hypothetical protein
LETISNFSAICPKKLKESFLYNFKCDTPICVTTQNKSFRCKSVCRRISGPQFDVVSSVVSQIPKSPRFCLLKIH